jgi:hypothetical protein
MLRRTRERALRDRLNASSLARFELGLPARDVDVIDSLVDASLRGFAAELAEPLLRR